MYEDYLNRRGINSLTRFRLSAQWLPIERDRHKRPIINREDRLCPLCKTCVGDEIHALMECKSDELKGGMTNMHLACVSHRLHGMAFVVNCLYSVLGARRNWPQPW